MTEEQKASSTIDSTIAIASGKGGVGKSTVTVNLACALAEKGKKVGILDADIYGPSQTIMLGVQDEKLLADKEKKIVPIENYGVKVVSIGFLSGPGSPVIWRGPLVNKALTQFIQDVAWGDLDVLLIDLPPGTGDAQLTICQNLTLNGAIIVTTPQEVALVDAEKGLHTFQKLNVPVLGIVENMSTFICPHCGEETPIFRSGGGQRVADELGIPLLAKIPIDPSFAPSGDTGRPVVLESPDSPLAKVFLTLAESIG